MKSRNARSRAVLYAKVAICGALAANSVVWINNALDAKPFGGALYDALHAILNILSFLLSIVFGFIVSGLGLKGSEQFIPLLAITTNSIVGATAFCLFILLLDVIRRLKNDKAP
jgi:hypothetical protein